MSVGPKRSYQAALHVAFSIEPHAAFLDHFSTFLAIKSKSFLFYLFLSYQPNLKPQSFVCFYPLLNFNHSAIIQNNIIYCNVTEKNSQVVSEK